MDGSMRLIKIKRMAAQIRSRYNADHDIIPGAPAVTYTDGQLLEMIELLVGKVIELDAEVDALMSAHNRAQPVITDRYQTFPINTNKDI